MLNRKDHKVANGSNHHTNGHHRRDAAKARQGRRRFIISPKAAGQALSAHPARPTRGRPPKTEPTPHGKAGQPAVTPTAGPAVPGQAVDLTETIKTLLH